MSHHKRLAIFALTFRRRVNFLPVVTSGFHFQLVKETLEEICVRLGIISQAEMEEYAMFALYDTGVFLKVTLLINILLIS